MIIGSRKKINIVSILILAVFLCLGVVSCNLKKQEDDPGISFTKIYDKSDEFSYTAVDIKQLPEPDGGYIILGKQEKEEPRPYVLRLDREGNVLWETSYDDFVVRENSKNSDLVEQEEELNSYIEPAADILLFDQEYYFFCTLTDRQNGLIYNALLKLSETEHRPSEVPLTSSFGNYFVVPMDAKKTSDGHILLFALNELDSQISFLKMNHEGSPIWESQSFVFDIVCSNQYPLIDKRYSFVEFSENPVNNSYYYHGYYNSNISYPDCFKIIPLNPSNGSLDPVNEYNIADRPFIAMEWSNGRYFGARMDKNIIYFVVNSQLQDIEENEIEQFELNESAPVCIKAMEVNDQPVVFFAGSAKNNRIVLYTYNLSNDRFSTKKYFGHTHIYEASALIETNDNGLAILGSTYVAGQHGRICLFKLSKTDLEKIQKGDMD